MTLLEGDREDALHRVESKSRELERAVEQV
jgi:hypothetical protein